MNLPRVEQDWQNLYPGLDVNAPLTIINKCHEPLVPQHPIKRTTSTINDIVRLPRARTRQFTEQLRSIGYNTADFNPPPTRFRASYAFSHGYPANLLAADAEIASDTLELCEYDMDEQDAHFVGFLVTEYMSAITGEIFEFLMSSIELEMFKLEMKMPLHQMEVPDDDVQKCAICCKSEGENLNAIVFCDGCDLPVHQDCYGVPFIPDGQWLCRRCLVHRGESVSCMFCPRTSGAFKQLVNEGKWGHVLCALWIPELQLGNQTLMEPIQNLESIPRERWRLRCSICGDPHGACIQCSYGDCPHAFHATCAQAAGLPMTMHYGIAGAINNLSTMEVLCREHCPPGTRVDFNAARKSLADEKAAKLSRLQLQPSKYPYWRTPQGTMIVPRVISNVLARYVNDRFNVTIDQQVIERICRYWVLKRDLTSSPFSRRLRALLDQNRHREATLPQQLTVYMKQKRELETLGNMVNELSEVLGGDEDALTEPEIAQKQENSITLTPPESPDEISDVVGAAAIQPAPEPVQLPADGSANGSTPQADITKKPVQIAVPDPTSGVEQPPKRRRGRPPLNKSSKKVPPVGVSPTKIAARTRSQARKARP